MPLIIDSAPDCITHEEALSADDLADFILQDNFKDCAGFGTFMPGSTYGEDGSSAETLYMILTWVGIAVMVIVLVAWVIYENRRLLGASRASARRARRSGSADHAAGTATSARNDGRRPMSSNGNSGKKQIEFLPLQTHEKGFERAMVAICDLLAIVVLVIVLFTNIGNEFRPTV